MSKIVSTWLFLDSRIEIDFLHDEESIEETWKREDICASCSVMLDVKRPKPVDLVFRKAPKSISQPAYFATAFRTDLIEKLRPHLKGLVVGKCWVLKKGKPVELPEYVSCYSKRKYSVLARGWAKSRYSMCEKCGNVLCQFSDGGSYLVLRDIRNRAACQLDSGGGIAISSELAKTIRWSRFPDAKLHPMQVRDKAMDDPIEDRMEGWGSSKRVSPKQVKALMKFF